MSVVWVWVDLREGKDLGIVIGRHTTHRSKQNRTHQKDKYKEDKREERIRRKIKSE